MTDFVWWPTPEHSARAQLTRFLRQTSCENYTELHRRSVCDVPWFTEQVLGFLNIRFDKPYTSVLDLSRGPAWPRFCVDGELNITESCLQHDPNRIAVISETEDGTIQKLTFGELRDQVERAAAGLRGIGLGKGDAVGIYTPMVIETVVALLALWEATGDSNVMALLAAFRQEASFQVGGQLRVSSTLAYTTIAAMYLEFIFFFVLAWLVSAWSQRHVVRALMLMGALLVVAEAIILTLTRGALIAISGALGLVVLARWRQWRLRLIFGVLLMTFSEIVMWENPVAHTPPEWAGRAVLYFALGSILIDLMVLSIPGILACVFIALFSVVTLGLGWALFGLVLLAVRAFGPTGLQMAVHLGFILAFFLVLPYSKMVHGVYRSAALLRRGTERKMKPLGGE